MTIEKTGTVQFGAVPLHEAQPGSDETWVPYIEVIDGDQSFRFVCDKGFDTYEETKSFVMFVYNVLTITDKKNLEFNQGGDPNLQN